MNRAHRRPQVEVLHLRDFLEKKLTTEICKFTRYLWGELLTFNQKITKTIMLVFVILHKLVNAEF